MCGYQNKIFRLQTCINYFGFLVNEFVILQLPLFTQFSQTRPPECSWSEDELLVCHTVTTTGFQLIGRTRFANENQIDSTAKFQLFFHLRKKTFFFHNTKWFFFRSCQERSGKKKQAHSKLCISLRCLPRALKNTTIGRRIRERKKRSSQIFFYYYFSTPIFDFSFCCCCLLFYFFRVWKQKILCSSHTIALDAVYSGMKIYHWDCGAL